MTHQLDGAGGRDVAVRWCALAQQRLEYLTELFESGRWRRFHNEVAFLENIREAKAAVEVWRDLSSRETSRDNRAIDMSWLGRTGSALPGGDIWRDRPHPPQQVEISVEASPENSIVPEGERPVAEEVLPALDRDASALMQDLAAAIEERYPLLRNRF